ncbi:hypothetical protein [Bacteroides heparinolyticus]|uniref:hypothetical protein n=1 Tax=Prevotella heparinolytica TaxID=28113 RepID=UPI00359FB542
MTKTTFILYLPVVLLVLLLWSCQDETDVPATETGNGQELTVNPSIGDYLPFSPEEGHTRAVGMPDTGKTQWMAGDKIFVWAHLYQTARIQGNGDTQAKLTYEYDGEQWSCLFGNTAIEPWKDAYGRNHPYKAARIVCYYMPTHNWDTLPNGRVIFQAINPTYDYGTREAFSQVIERTEESGIKSLDFNIDFAEKMKPRRYSRLRIVSSPDYIVTVNWGENNLQDPSRIALNESGNTSVTWDMKSSGRTRADANGNAFFYGKWDQAVTFNVKIERPLGNYAEYVKDSNFTTSAASINGASYVIDMR